VYFVLFLAVSSHTIGTYSNYVTLVGGWGNEELLEKPSKAAIVCPALKAAGKLMMGYYSCFSTHPYGSGIVRPELLCLAYLGLSSTNDLR
jgi:hypothetical protein